MKQKSKFYLKGWTVTRETEDAVELTAEKLQSNNSFALRQLVRLGKKKLDEMEQEGLEILSLSNSKKVCRNGE